MMKSDCYLIDEIDRMKINDMERDLSCPSFFDQKSQNSFTLLDSFKQSMYFWVFLYANDES